MKQELIEGYYCENFKTLIAFVEKIYFDLLLNEEKEFINIFRNLSLDAARLWVRLCMRIKPFYFKHQLQYAEIGSIDNALDELSRHKFILMNQGVSSDELLAALNKVELKENFGDREINFLLKKDELVASILKSYHENEILNIIFSKFTLVYKNKSEIVEKILHFFFGNRHQDLTEFVLQDLGLVRYEKYCLDGQSRLFQTRDQFEQSILLSRLSEESYLAVEADDEQELLRIVSELPEKSLNYRFESRLSKILNRCAYFFERKGKIELAKSLYLKSKRGNARERLARILFSEKQTQESKEICESILQMPYSQDEFEFAEKFLNKINKQKPINIKINLNENDLIIVNNHEQAVEQLAQQYLSKDGNQVYYVENTLFNSLFGLLYWDLIFAPIAGVFCHPFQIGPIDLFEVDFLICRNHLLNQKSDLINSNPNCFNDIIWKNFHEKNGIANPFINWNELTEELIHLSLNLIPLSHLLLIFNRILKNVKENSSGLPDLISFNLALQKYELIEIKGPGDKLQKNQIRWLEFFHISEIPYQVAYVQWAK